MPSPHAPSDAKASDTDLTDSAAGWEVAKPSIWLAVAAFTATVTLLAVLFLVEAAASGSALHQLLLGVTGLCAAVGIFGGLRARARLRGDAPRLGLELGLPLLGCGLIVGLVTFANRPFADIDLTVVIQAEHNKAEAPVKGTGTVWLQLGEERLQQPIDARGQAVFSRLPLRFRMGETTVGVEAAGFETLSPTGPVRIAGKPLTVIVRHAARTLRGEVTDESGVPVTGALIYVMNGPTKKTDELGRFEMVIPGETAAGKIDFAPGEPANGQIDFAITAENFLVYRKRFALPEKPDPLVIRLKKVP